MKAGLKWLKQLEPIIWNIYECI